METVQRRPFWSLSSIAAPVLGYSWAFMRASHPGDMMGGVVVLGVLAFASIAGFAAACVAIVRKESPGVFTAVGFLVNLAPPAAFILFRLVS